jgi:uncharacterized protein YukE
MGGGGGSWGAEDELWPVDAANTVKHWAAKAGNAAVAAAVDKIRDWLGHPEVVMSLATTWSPDASRYIADSKEGINSAKTDLKAYWEGPAFESFNTYIDNVVKVIDATYKVMTDMSDHMLELRRTITETYQAAIVFIGNCARAIIDAAGSAIQNLKDLWGGVCGAILEALSKFLGEYTELMTKALNIMTEYDKTGVLLQRRASELQVPDPLPRSVGEPGNWKVHKAAS